MRAHDQNMQGFRPPPPPACRYGAEQGRPELREAIAREFYGRTGITAGEIFVSDGSKCDIGRLQLMFGSDVSVAVQVSPLSASHYSTHAAASGLSWKRAHVSSGLSGRSRLTSSFGEHIMQLAITVSLASIWCYWFADLQDPSYPAYVDSSIIIGQTGEYREDIQGFDGIEYMRCGPDNSFFPDLSQVSPHSE